MNKKLEKEMGRDLKELELTKEYENDLLIIQRCVNKLVRMRGARTLKYEQDIKRLR